jgi:hypothetical protein
MRDRPGEAGTGVRPVDRKQFPWLQQNLPVRDLVVIAIGSSAEKTAIRSQCGPSRQSLLNLFENDEGDGCVDQQIMTAGSPEAWLLFSLVVLVLAGLLIPTIFIAILAWSSWCSVQHRIGPAPLGLVSVIRLLAETKSARALWVILTLLASGLGAYLSLTPRTMLICCWS